MFNILLQDDEKKARDAFGVLSTNFVGSIRAENYKLLYHILGYNMSLKIHVPHSHFVVLLDNCVVVNDEHGERFYQEIERIGKRYQRKWSTSMLVDYCLTLTRNAPEQLHKRQTKGSLKYE
jgi:hypothetical protein